MLQNSRVTAFTIFELLRENQLARVKYPTSPPPPPARLGLIGIFENLLTSDKVEKCKQVKITSYFVKEK